MYSIFSIKWGALRSYDFEFPNHMEAIAVSTKYLFFMVVIIVFWFLFFLLLISLFVVDFLSLPCLMSGGICGNLGWLRLQKSPSMMSNKE